MGSSIDLKQMQKIEFDILRTVHTLCQENHITYYLGYGTMLGAVRHQGFIPWDDDVDIVMPRDDYRRFLQLAPQYLPEHLKLCHLGNTAPYNYDFAKIQDKRTILIEDTYSYLGIESGVYIDIFSLDGYPADEKKLHNLAMQHQADVRISEYSFLGGTRAVIPGKNILIDNSFQAKLAEARENFQFDSAAQTGGTIHG